MTAIALGPFFQPWVPTPGFTVGLPNPEYPVNETRTVFGKGVMLARETPFQFRERDRAHFVKDSALDARIRRAYKGQALTAEDLARARANHFTHDIQKRPLFNRAAREKHMTQTEQGEHERVVAYKEGNPARWAVGANTAELQAKLDNPNRIGRRWLEDAGGPILPMQGYESSGKGPNNLELQKKDIASFIERRDRGYIPQQGAQIPAPVVKSLDDILRQAAEAQTRGTHPGRRTMRWG